MNLTLDVKFGDQNAYFAKKNIVYNISKNTQPKQILQYTKGNALQWDIMD
jgi:hypothetical protein